MKQAHVFISGNVQGVFFRDFTLENARNLGLKGWVKNTIDGKVEAVFQGNETEINNLIEIIKTGPKSSNVDKIDIKWEEVNEEFEDFVRLN